ncbi:MULTISPECIES: helix-turn-helix transcriptional regulator [Ferrimonas]|uniref:ArsR/SmtB family transcription factor n=1 Tax=Ferrimonas TaxID=44011 RepID=UPI00048A4213|nr:MULTISPECIES: metalloregulator ArsR/SmtB family transcription factor [Ferrimonas]USD37599.1 winged helix-turn-helix transcriptional regulator [Ferrimonas sp. SCSIO 43195]
MALTIDLETMTGNAQQASKLLKTIANPHRLMLLCLIGKQELTVGELNEQVPLSQSALSQHLAVLRNEGLVTTRKEAQQVWYQLDSPEVEAVINLLYDLYCGKGQ